MKTRPQIKIIVAESIFSENVDQADIASHIAAGGAYATEAQVLKQFIVADGIPNTIADDDGDQWFLVRSQGNETGLTYDTHTYELSELCAICAEEPARWEWRGLRICSSCEEEEATGDAEEIADECLQQ